MSSIAIRAARVAAVAASSALLFTALPSAAAAPAFDGQGYVDSTARCSSSDTAVLFGSTETSRVAICKTSGGQYTYRGVRVRDGAKLVLSASSNGDGSYQANNDGITYTVSSNSLTVSSGGSVTRKESWVDFHGPKAPASSTGTSTSTAPTSTSAAPTTTAPTSTSTTPTSTTPLGPPLAAEVGGSTR
ncbi:hypothetical protein BayCH28_13235 [Mycolicibacterium sp. CH28]|uniref:hypothetical protein n=1 Tax=Mycolicibacterium sp. CH28 TaxID=2512237 RepID=UPI0010806261|nr:hypothetical protein [Mycolicibacterium sp. CH28]TGD87343.1 hypothetical protein BayCH28_13235 [Mycolicibacterium sp. CH28]